MIGLKENSAATQANEKSNWSMCTVRESAHDIISNSLAKMGRFKDSGISRMDQFIKNLQNRMENSPPFRHFIYALAVLAVLPASIVLLCSGLVIGSAGLISFAMLAAVILVTFLIALLALTVVLTTCGLLAGGATAIVYSALAAFFLLSIASRNIYSLFDRTSSKLPKTQPKTD